MTSSTELAWLDATDQARMVAAREVSALELVDAAIKRVERLDPQLNAVIHPRFEQARAEASSADLPAGRFRGVPMVLKDLGCVSEGDPDHQGNRLLAGLGNTAPADATPTGWRISGSTRSTTTCCATWASSAPRSTERSARAGPEGRPRSGRRFAGGRQWRGNTLTLTSLPGR